MRPRALLLFAVSLVGSSGHTSELELPATIRASLVLRILAYDHALGRHPGETLAVAVVHVGARAGDAATLVDAFRALAGQRVQGRPVQVESFELGRLHEAPANRGDVAALVLVTDAASPVSPEVLSRFAPGALVFTGDSSLVDQGVAAIALGTRDAHPHIKINVDLARASGAHLDAALLRLAETVGGEAHR